MLNDFFLIKDLRFVVASLRENDLVAFQTSAVNSLLQPLDLCLYTESEDSLLTRGHQNLINRTTASTDAVNLHTKGTSLISLSTPLHKPAPPRSHEQWMRRAIAEAGKAQAKDELPIGCV